MMRYQALYGMGLVLVSAFCFASSGPVGKALYASGDWTPASVTLLRLLGCAVLLAVPALISLRGRWAEVWRNRSTVLAYGIVAAAGVQLLYFMSVQHLTVAVALLLEMTAPLMIVFWLWMRSGRRPSAITFAGMAVSMAGLVLILDPRGASLHVGGVILALGAAVCLCTYFLVGAKSDVGIPAVGLTGLGMGIGAGTVAALWPTGILDYGFSSADVLLGGRLVPWYVAVGLVVLGTAGAYFFGIIGMRLVGATVSSFVNLIEVPFSVVVAWLVLAELPTYVQIVGGAILLAGVVFIKLGEAREQRPATRAVVTETAPTPIVAEVETVADVQESGTSGAGGADGAGGGAEPVVAPAESAGAPAVAPAETSRTR